MKYAALIFGDDERQPKAASVKLSSPEPGQVVRKMDGSVYRVASKLASPDGVVVKLSSLQGEPVQTPLNFRPVGFAAARFATWLSYHLAYNRDFDLYVNAYIEKYNEQHSEEPLPYPIGHDGKPFRWANWFDKVVAPKLFVRGQGDAKDKQQVKDDAIHDMLFTVLGQRNVLSQFAAKAEGRGVNRQNAASKLTDFLISSFMYRISEMQSKINAANPTFGDPLDQQIRYQRELYNEARNNGDKAGMAAARKRIKQIEDELEGMGDVATTPMSMSMWQPGRDMDSDEDSNVLEQEQHGVGQSEFESVEARRDVARFRDGFGKWLVQTEGEGPGENFATMFDLFWEALQDRDDVKRGDIEEDWISRTGLSFGAFKSYYSRLPEVVERYIESHRTELGDRSIFVQLMEAIKRDRDRGEGKKRREREHARPAMVSSLRTAGVEEDFAEAAEAVVSPLKEASFAPVKQCPAAPKRASTGLNCWFFEWQPGKWYYLLEHGSAPKNAWDWREHSTAYGPFASEEEAVKHLQDNHANPGGWSTAAHDPKMAQDKVLAKLVSEAQAPQQRRRYRYSSSKIAVKLLRGDQLTPDMQKQVLNAFIYRWTHENRRRGDVYHCDKCDVRQNPYVNTQSAEGHQHPTIPLQHDQEFLKDHAFYFTNAGRLLANKHAEPAYLAPEQKAASVALKFAMEKAAYNPGKGQYIFQADNYCEPCGKALADRLVRQGKAPADPGDEHTYDSDQYPKGPYYQQESDAPEFCARCGMFLENPLTSAGYDYLNQMILEHEADGRGQSDIIDELKAFYPEREEQQPTEDPEVSEALDAVERDTDQDFLRGMRTSADITKRKKLPPNTVIREVISREGHNLGYVHGAYDGTPEDMVRVAQAITDQMWNEYNDASNGESRIFATDETGRLNWRVSPNFAHVVEGLKLGADKTADYACCGGDGKHREDCSVRGTGSASKKTGGVTDRYLSPHQMVKEFTRPGGQGDRIRSGEEFEEKEPEHITTRMRRGLGDPAVDTSKKAMIPHEFDNADGQAIRNETYQDTAYVSGEADTTEFRQPRMGAEDGQEASVGQTIYRQLGGGKFKAMTGARDFVGHDRGLSFRLPGAGGFTKSGINYVQIVLEPSDTYKVVFGRTRAGKSSVVSTHDDVYAENLREVFERETGLYTSLGTMGKRGDYAPTMPQEEIDVLRGDRGQARERGLGVSETMQKPWWCMDCNTTVDLDQQGRCENCGGEAVDVASHGKSTPERKYDLEGNPNIGPRLSADKTAQGAGNTTVTMQNQNVTTPNVPGRGQPMAVPDAIDQQPGPHSPNAPSTAPRTPGLQPRIVNVPPGTEPDDAMTAMASEDDPEVLCPRCHGSNVEVDSDPEGYKVWCDDCEAVTDEGAGRPGASAQGGFGGDEFQMLEQMSQIEGEFPEGPEPDFDAEYEAMRLDQFDKGAAEHNPYATYDKLKAEYDRMHEISYEGGKARVVRKKEEKKAGEDDVYRELEEEGRQDKELSESIAVDNEFERVYALPEDQREAWLAEHGWVKDESWHGASWWMQKPMWSRTDHEEDIPYQDTNDAIEKEFDLMERAHTAAGSNSGDDDARGVGDLYRENFYEHRTEGLSTDGMLTGMKEGAAGQCCPLAGSPSHDAVLQLAEAFKTGGKAAAEELAKTLIPPKTQRWVGLAIVDAVMEHVRSKSAAAPAVAPGANIHPNVQQQMNLMQQEEGAQAQGGPVIAITPGQGQEEAPERERHTVEPELPNARYHMMGQLAAEEEDRLLAADPEYGEWLEALMNNRQKCLECGKVDETVQMRDFEPDFPGEPYPICEDCYLDLAQDI